MIPLRDVVLVLRDQHISLFKQKSTAPTKKNAALFAWIPISHRCFAIEMSHGSTVYLRSLCKQDTESVRDPSFVAQFFRSLGPVLSRLRVSGNRQFNRTGRGVYGCGWLEVCEEYIETGSIVCMYSQTENTNLSRNEWWTALGRGTRGATPAIIICSNWLVTTLKKKEKEKKKEEVNSLLRWSLWRRTDWKDNELDHTLKFQMYRWNSPLLMFHLCHQA